MFSLLVVGWDEEQAARNSLTQEASSKEWEGGARS
jgi:hypothetical protein